MVLLFIVVCLNYEINGSWDEGEIVGGKTGYTDEAGLCLASEAIVNGRKYIAITVNAEGNHNTEPFYECNRIT